MQDVANKIMSFAQHGPRAVCVISANGAISNVTLRQQSSSGGNVTYEVIVVCPLCAFCLQCSVTRAAGHMCSKF